MSCRPRHLLLLTFSVVLFGYGCGDGGPAGKTTGRAAAQIDALLSKSFSPGAPGGVVMAVQRGEVVFRKAYGSANIELGVPMLPEHVFRLGSVTKQFTAVAILQLAEAGKLKLDDDITNYVPSLQTNGHKITIEHLLNHTSGLPNITDQPAWQGTIREALTLEKQLAFINDRPALFAPGTDWAYSNTGYRLLGEVVEKASGQTYADYVREQIFKPAGMTHSAFDVARRVTPLRAAGYTADSDGMVANADFASMAQPHGAGALMANVDDLRKWNDALSAGMLLSRELLQRAHTSVRLADGRDTSCGYGWHVSFTAGHRTLEHSGGTYGFNTHVLSLPDAELYVVALFNSDRPKLSPVVVCTQIAEILLGPTGARAVTVPAETLQRYAGVYRALHEKIAFEVEGGTFAVKDQTGRSFPLAAISETQFFAPKIQMRYAFVDDPDRAGRKRVRLQPRGRIESFATWIDEPLLNPVVDVPVATLDRYAATYEVNPKLSVTVRRDGSSLTAQATGQPVTHLMAESQTRFRLKESAARIEFKTDDAGAVTGVVLIQGGRETPARRVK